MFPPNEPCKPITLNYQLNEQHSRIPTHENDGIKVQGLQNMSDDTICFKPSRYVPILVLLYTACTLTAWSSPNLPTKTWSLIQANQKLIPKLVSRISIVGIGQLGPSGALAACWHCPWHQLYVLSWLLATSRPKYLATGASHWARLWLLRTEGGLALPLFYLSWDGPNNASVLF